MWKTERKNILRHSVRQCHKLIPVIKVSGRWMQWGWRTEMSIETIVWVQFVLLHDKTCHAVGFIYDALWWKFIKFFQTYCKSITLQLGPNSKEICGIASINNISREKVLNSASVVFDKRIGNLFSAVISCTYVLELDYATKSLVVLILNYIECFGLPVQVIKCVLLFLCWRWSENSSCTEVKK